MLPVPAPSPSRRPAGAPEPGPANQYSSSGPLGHCHHAPHHKDGAAGRPPEAFIELFEHAMEACVPKLTREQHCPRCKTKKEPDMLDRGLGAVLSQEVELAVGRTTSQPESGGEGMWKWGCGPVLVCEWRVEPEKMTGEYLRQESERPSGPSTDKDLSTKISFCDHLTASAELQHQFPAACGRILLSITSRTPHTLLTHTPPLCVRMKFLTLVLLLSAFSSLTLTEVVNSLSSFKEHCPSFFIRNPENQNDIIIPTIFPEDQYRMICQRWKNKYRFATVYDTKRRIPVYSAYTFLQKGKTTRSKVWKIEPQLENIKEYEEKKEMMDSPRDEKTVRKIINQAVNSDYSNSSYTRGHVFPRSFAADRDQADSTFTLTNIAPQTNYSNWEWEKKVETPMLTEIQRNCRLDQNHQVYIVTGVVPGNKWLPLKGKEREKKEGINIPSHFWSAFCCTNKTDHGKFISRAYIAKQENFNVQTTTTDFNVQTTTTDFNVQTTTTDFNVRTTTTDFNVRTTTTDFNVQPTTTDFNVQPSTTDFNVQPSTTDFNVQTSTTDFNVQPSITDFNAQTSTTDFNVQTTTTDFNVQTTTIDNLNKQLTELYGQDFSVFPGLKLRK
ncbi:uncharacterized protein LOC113523687 [Pangasianodon hypophthalmus]|uniref:uncharacterized protein LOC113523687 n=1 Tax=Pangasianodon hypophthalmus TaxID=310915 RepID=UPI0023071773|nr:uncharacterized protein LOC113523687 [Pangasianodon hypophthalmus]